MNNIIELIKNFFAYGLGWVLTVAAIAAPYFVIQEYDLSGWWLPLLTFISIALVKLACFIICFVIEMLSKFMDALRLTNRNF